MSDDYVPRPIDVLSIPDTRQGQIEFDKAERAWNREWREAERRRKCPGYEKLMSMKGKVKQNGV